MDNKNPETYVGNADDSNENFLSALKTLLETPAQNGGITNRIMAWQVYHENDRPIVGKDSEPFEENKDIKPVKK